ncbi:MAG: YARHG domain-containing protein [Deltaproteobacteria bacterium]|nr:YARHG domain-containing protein [Deltaproteobacteria bacterium]
MLRRIVSLSALGLVLSAVAPAARANDGYYGGDGASPMPMATTDIRMAAEHVVLRWDPKRESWEVTCDFTFANDADRPIAATIGFPFPVVHGDEGDIIVPAGGKRPAEGRPLVWNFKTRVDGRPVKVRETRTLTNPELPDVSYEFAYVWEATFPPKGTLRIQNTYRHGRSGSVGGDEWARYVLMTGTLWKGGRIGKATLEVLVPDRRRVPCPADVRTDMAHVQPAGGKLTQDAAGFQVRWELEAFQPKGDLWVCMMDLDALASQRAWELGEADLGAMDAEALRLARNEVYARYGYVFQDPALAEHFGREWWYRPDPGFKAARLPREARQVVQRIKAEEARR